VDAEDEHCLATLADDRLDEDADERRERARSSRAERAIEAGLEYPGQLGWRW
jgi:hypothetical protein